MTKILESLIKKILNLFNLRLIKNSNFKDLDFPIEANNEIKKMIEISSKFSMTSKKRMYALYQAVSNSQINKLDGDFVECGVWRGGNILFLKLLNDYFDLNKNIYAFDTFNGMTEPSDLDITYKGHSAKNAMQNNKKSEKDMNIHCYASIEMVKKNIMKHSDLDKISFIKGPVEKTLINEKNLPKKICVLRLDTDFYSSTKIELEILFPKLVHGGVLIIDDYGYWQGAKKAVDEYFDNKYWLHIVDNTCRYLIKK